MLSSLECLRFKTQYKSPPNRYDELVWVSALRKGGHRSGVGSVYNAAIAGLAAQVGLPKFKVDTEVIQDAILDLLASGQVLGASTCALTLSGAKLSFLHDDFDDLAGKIVLRPQEVSNNSGVARRLGVIATNTAIEVDIDGHANSTHAPGRMRRRVPRRRHKPGEPSPGSRVPRSAGARSGPSVRSSTSLDQDEIIEIPAGHHPTCPEIGRGPTFDASAPLGRLFPRLQLADADLPPADLIRPLALGDRSP